MVGLSIFNIDSYVNVLLKKMMHQQCLPLQQKVRLECQPMGKTVKRPDQEFGALLL